VKWTALVPLLVGLVGGVGIARADTPPSQWDLAKDPAELERYKLHVHVVELLHPPQQPGYESGLGYLLAERARAELEQASAATSPDVRLRFDLGEAYSELKRYQQVIDVLRPALAMAPRDSSTSTAWWLLGLAYAKLDRTAEERDAYDAFLEVALSDRFTARLNRAEAEMRLGNLDAAVAGYEDVIDRFESSLAAYEDWRTLVLARWGLAVALDRNGDPSRAEREAAIAATEDPSEEIIGDPEGVFFVPEYERDWYFGLGRAEHAKQEQDPRMAFQWWALVEQTWADYIARASADDRWVPLARAHLVVAERKRSALQKSFGKNVPELASPIQNSRTTRFRPMPIPAGRAIPRPMRPPRVVPPPTKP
jgi:tetratricopeptide (TPR) repeat protein